MPRSVESQVIPTLRNSSNVLQEIIFKHSHINLVVQTVNKECLRIKYIH